MSNSIPQNARVEKPPTLPENGRDSEAIPPTDTNEIWKQVQATLQTQMAQNDYYPLFGQTQLIIEDGLYKIQSPTEQIKEILENRQILNIERALAGVVSEPVEMVFVVKQEKQSPSPGPGEFSVELVYFDPRDKGFVQTSNYAILFWQPYLNLLPFALWQTIRSFAWREKDEAYPSIMTLANTVANGNRHKILGRAAQANRKRQIGALEILEKEAIIKTIVTGEGYKTSYRFKTLDKLPLLTQAQVSKLPKSLQESHKRFIKSCNIDYNQWLHMDNRIELMHGA